MIRCDDCKHQHLGSRCGMTFAQRIRTVRLDPRAVPTRTLKNYYDRESVKQAFGEGSEERYWDESDGRGAIWRYGDDFVRQDRKTGDYETIPAEADDWYTGADIEEVG